LAGLLAHFKSYAPPGFLLSNRCAVRRSRRSSRGGPVLLIDGRASGQYHDLSAGPVFLHVAVGFNDLVKQ
jgi:hypothetical protein